MEELESQLQKETEFLLARLDEFSFSDEINEMERDWYGHIEPSIARLKMILKELNE